MRFFPHGNAGDGGVRCGGGAAVATSFGGNLGQILKSAAIAGATAVAYAGVGFISSASASTIGPAGAWLKTSPATRWWPGLSVASPAAVAARARCRPALAPPCWPYTNTGNYGANLIVNAADGGAASVAGGGKFENGAVSGAFGYLVSPEGLADAREAAGNGGPMGEGMRQPELRQLVGPLEPGQVC